MNRVLTDADRRAELASRGLIRASRFPWRRCARETLAVSEEAGASPPQTPQARAQQVLRALLIMDVS